jgi:hypothetical protein
VVALHQEGRWSLGALVTQLWSIQLSVFLASTIGNSGSPVFDPRSSALPFSVHAMGEKLRDAVEEKGQQPGVVLTQRQRLLFPSRVR